MKVTTAYVLIWCSVALTASVGIFVTKSLWPLWAFLFPSFISIKAEEGE